MARQKSSNTGSVLTDKIPRPVERRAIKQLKSLGKQKYIDFCIFRKKLREEGKGLDEAFQRAVLEFIPDFSFEYKPKIPPKPKRQPRHIFNPDKESRTPKPESTTPDDSDEAIVTNFRQSAEWIFNNLGNTNMDSGSAPCPGAVFWLKEIQASESVKNTFLTTVIPKLFEKIKSEGGEQKNNLPEQSEIIQRNLEALSQKIKEPVNV